MSNYSIGFIFNSDLDKILLIHKIKPDWQKGKINAVGGKIEQNESSLDCVVREVYEETSLQIESSEWQSFGKIINSDKSEAHLFTCIYKGDLNNASTSDGEIIEWFNLESLPSNIMHNLTWLIPLALDKLQHKDIDNVVVTNSK